MEKSRNRQMEKWEICEILLDFVHVLCYNACLRLEQEKRMDHNLVYKRIFEFLSSFAQASLDETKITYDPITRHTIVRVDDEIDLENLSAAMADAILVKVD